MNEIDPIGQLLRRVDAAAAAPAATPNVAARVRRRHVRRQRVSRGAALVGSVAAVVAIVSAVVMTRGERGTSQIVHVGLTPATSPTDGAEDATRRATAVAARRREFVRLSRECEQRERAVDRALSANTGPRRESKALARRAVRLDPAIELGWQREQAALVLVRQGDRLADELKLPVPAAVAYRQASETFPGTRWAAVARARLTGEN